ncbi:hypothetical protein [Kitasatospora phosalacinea]|uniref:hypothetical protein n=1 Tax=Kitasatospora phosalacinea TaxID=2065 RepID=UPI00255575F7|nr:hypothetical protein [Kitasatospora phosalacinea]
MAAAVGCAVLLVSALAGCTSGPSPASDSASGEASLSVDDAVRLMSEELVGEPVLPDSVHQAGLLGGARLFAWTLSDGRRCLGALHQGAFLCLHAAADPPVSGPLVRITSSALYERRWLLVLDVDGERVAGASCGAQPETLFDLGADQVAGGVRRTYVLMGESLPVGPMTPRVLRDDGTAQSVEPLEWSGPASAPGLERQAC